MIGLWLALPALAAPVKDDALALSRSKWEFAQIIEQVCLKDGLAHDSAKYCASCRARGGDATRWTYQLMCDGRPKPIIVVSILECAPHPGAAAEQQRQHRQNALADLPGAQTPCNADSATLPLFM